MFAVPEQLKAVTHPRIASMYMKKDFSISDMAEDVLVIDTSFSGKEDDACFDDYMMEILLDLPAIRSQAENSFGKIDRIDIRTH